MCKILFYTIFSIFLSSITIVQSQNSSVKFGIRVGVNYSNIDFSRGSPPPESPIATNWEPGFAGGFLMVVKFAPKLYLQQEYLYSQMGGTILETDTRYRMNYLSLPIFLRWETRRFSFLAGPHFGLLINANYKKGAELNNLTQNFEHRNLGLAGGVEVEILNGLAIGFRYLFGLNHLTISEDELVQEFKFEMVQVSVVYLFSEF